MPSKTGIWDDQLESIEDLIVSRLKVAVHKGRRQSEDDDEALENKSVILTRGGVLVSNCRAIRHGAGPVSHRSGSDGPVISGRQGKRSHLLGIHTPNSSFAKPGTHTKICDGYTAPKGNGLVVHPVV